MRLQVVAGKFLRSLPYFVYRLIRLLTRAVHMLGLDNVHVAQGDAFDVADEWKGITFRGSVRAPEAVGLAARMLTLDGTAVLGLSRRPEPPDRTRDLLGTPGPCPEAPWRTRSTPPR